MRWAEVREVYPGQWLVIEALESRTEGDRHIVGDIAVIERCADGEAALASYRRLHLEYPQRLLYYVHTDREQLDITERQWVGVRRGHEARVDG